MSKFNIKDKLKTVNILDIIPYTGNAKIHSDNQIQQIKKSINNNQYIQPIAVDKNNIICIGNGRYEAIKQLSPDCEIDVIDLSHLDEKQIKKLRILDNKIISNDWDKNILITDIESIYENFDNLDIIFDETGLRLEDIKITEFEPVTEDEQGQLDEKQATICPECGHKWIK